MASSSSSGQKKVSLMMFLVFLLTTTNTLNSCMATRASGRLLMMVNEEDHKDASYNSLMAVKYFHEKEEKLIPAESLYFAKLPKNVPIPPSAPSNRHNSSPQD